MEKLLSLQEDICDRQEEVILRKIKEKFIDGNFTDPAAAAAAALNTAAVAMDDKM